LAKYFGDIVDAELEKLPDSKISMSSGGKQDVDSNGELAGDIPSPKYEFIYESSVKLNYKTDIEGLVFKLEGKNAKAEKVSRYGFVKSVDTSSGGNEFCYIIYSKSFLNLKQICRESVSGSPEFEKGDSVVLNNNSEEYYITKIKKVNLEKILMKKSSVKIIGKNDGGDDEIDFSNIESSYILVNKGEDKYNILKINNKSIITNWSDKNRVNIKPNAIPESQLK
jgi:hypothetical protein